MSLRNYCAERIDAYHDLLTIGAGMHYVNSDEVIFTNVQGRKIELSVGKIKDGKYHCFFDNMLLNPLTCMSTIHGMFPMEAFSRNLPLYGMIMDRTRDMDDRSKKFFIIVNYLIVLYFILTKNKCLLKKDNIKELLDIVKGEISEINLDNILVVNELYLEAINVAVELITQLEQDPDFRKPFAFLDIFFPFKYKIIFDR